MTLLTTDRLVLREWREQDLDAYAAIMADERVTRHLAGGVPRDRAQSWRNIAECVGHQRLRGYSQSAVIERGAGRLIGRGGLWRPEGWPGLEVGWVLDPAAWGRGYATELGAACRDFAFDRLGAAELISVIHPDNVRSQAVAERIGHRLLRAAELNGERVLIYGQLRPAGR